MDFSFTLVLARIILWKDQKTNPGLVFFLHEGAKKKKMWANISSNRNKAEFTILICIFNQNAKLLTPEQHWCHYCLILALITNHEPNVIHMDTRTYTDSYLASSQS